MDKINKTSMPVVSVIIPSYNHARYIDEAIDSAINQDYKGFIEIIVIDDASTDSSKNILANRGMLEKENRSLVIIFKDINSGINNSIDRGINLAKGSYIQILASDDAMCLNKISEQLAYIEENKFDCVYSRGYYLNGSNREISLDKFRKSYLNGHAYKYVSVQDWGAPLAQSGLFKKEVLFELSSIRHRYKSDDWAMQIMLFKNYKVGYLDLPLFYYRIHSDNTFSKYNYTFPMRLDVILNIVDERWRLEALSNIFHSQSECLLSDKKLSHAFKFLLISLIFRPQIKHLKAIIKILTPKALLDLKRFLK
jgi:glycosyltransferase involved in cell wall biosynthesis